MDAEKTYLESLTKIERISAFAARSGHLNADETVEFVQIVRVKLFEDDYAVIRKFEGKSLFSTYLTTVIFRLFYQWRVEHWGKWRPSAEAKRIGNKAITLERLLTRDGFSLNEAVSILTTRSGAQYSVAELEAIYVRLPLRNPRPMLISHEVAADAVAVESDADDRAQRGDRERVARQAAKAVDDVLRTLDAEDRLILQMRFWDACKVPDIARTLHIDQKKIYKRLDKIFAVMRRALEAAGIARTDIGSLLVRGDQEIHLGVLPGGIAGMGPSHPTGEEPVRGGEGRLP